MKGVTTRSWKGQDATAQLRELIVASPASSMLFPLTTALERELGLETRVAKEVEEVAEDSQRDLEERRKGRCH